MSTILEDLKVLGENLERLKIENNLLRAASKEQKELNGSLRVELNDSVTTLALWVNWFNNNLPYHVPEFATLDSDAHAEGSKLLTKSIEVINGRG